MALDIRPNCEFCDKDLPPESTEARICSYECTFCVDCVALLSRIAVERAANVGGYVGRCGQRLVAERAARQPESERTRDGESDGREGVGEVALRPRARSYERHFAVRSRGGNAASALR